MQNSHKHVMLARMYAYLTWKKVVCIPASSVPRICKQNLVGLQVISVRQVIMTSCITYFRFMCNCRGSMRGLYAG